jgi:hypothetical protein
VPDWAAIQLLLSVRLVDDGCFSWVCFWVQRRTQLARPIFYDLWVKRCGKAKRKSLLGNQVHTKLYSYGVQKSLLLSREISAEWRLSEFSCAARKSNGDVISDRKSSPSGRFMLSCIGNRSRLSYRWRHSQSAAFPSGQHRNYTINSLFRTRTILVNDERQTKRAHNSPNGNRSKAFDWRRHFWSATNPSGWTIVLLL